MWIRCSCLLLSSFLLALPRAQAVPINVLWWDSTPEWGGQAPDSARQAMSDFLTGFGGGGIFNSTYVSAETPGSLATHLGSNSYDVIVFDATSISSKFNAGDQTAIQNHYESNQNLLLDGTLYIRNINYNATTSFPGPGGDTGDFTANEIYQLGSRGGGIMIGTDHDCCQVDANEALHAILPGASFSGNTTPSTDGVFTGTDLLSTPIASVIPLNVFNHWDSVPSEAIAPTGLFTDYMGRSVTLFSQVDVADDPGGGPKFSYISTSWQPSGGGVIITDPDPSGGISEVPEPSTVVLCFTGLALVALKQFRRGRGGNSVS